MTFIRDSYIKELSTERVLLRVRVFSQRIKDISLSV